MLSSKARDTFRHVTEPAGHALARVGITANGLTAIGLAGSLGAGALVATGQPVIGGAVSLLSGLPDMLDGAVAKASGRVSRRGAFLDSVVDRLSDAAVVGHHLVRGHPRPRRHGRVIALVLGPSLIVSYIKARAESLGFACNVGIAERPERVIVLGLALLLGHAEAGLRVLVAGTAITVVQRILVVWQQSDVGPDIGR